MENMDYKPFEIPKNPLETQFKVPLELELMKRMMGEQMTDDMIMQWIRICGEEVSKIVDNEINCEIREAARAKNYEAAADLIYQKLPEQIKNHYLNKAA